MEGGGGGGGSCKGIIIPRIDLLLDRLFIEIQLAGKSDKVHAVLYMYYVNQGIYISPLSEFSFCKLKQYKLYSVSVHVHVHVHDIEI